jgi:hypothetical protein
VGEAFASAADGLVHQQSLDPELDTKGVLTALFKKIAEIDMDAQSSPEKLKRSGSAARASTLASSPLAFPTDEMQSQLRDYKVLSAEEEQTFNELSRRWFRANLHLRRHTRNRPNKPARPGGRNWSYHV